MSEKRWDPLTKEWVALEKETKQDLLSRQVRQLPPEEKKVEDYQILDNIVSGIIAVNLEGKLIIFNKRAEQIIGFKADEVIGKDLGLIPSQLAKFLSDTLKMGKTYHREEVHILPENILVGVSTSQFYNFRGEMIGAVMVFADLLKIKETEKNLNRKNDDEFWKMLATRLAHEIKNPLVSIDTFTQLLPTYYNDSQFRENFHATVSNDIHRINSFVEKLITLASPLELNLQIQDLKRAVEEALNSIWDKNYHRSIIVVWRGEDIPFINFDFYKLKEAFRNILINAIEAIPKRGALIISTHLVKGKFVEIRFHDTGKGIASENLSQIFLPLFTDKEGYLGLGLTMAKRIIEAHKGFIEVKSKIQEGSTFSVYLPLDNA